MKPRVMLIPDRVIALFGAALYILLFHWVYVHQIAPRFAYMGYQYVSPNWLYLSISVLLALTPILHFPVAITRPSQVVYWILYVVVFVPSMLVPIYTLGSSSDLWMFLIAICACINVLGLMYRIPLARIHRPRLGPFLFWASISLFALFAYAAIISRFGLNFQFVALSDIYDVRAEYRDDLAAEGRLIAYVMTWQSKVINPLIIAYGIIRRRPVVISGGFLGQLLIYSITGLKGTLFSILLILLLTAAFHFSKKQFGMAVTWGTATVVLVASAASALFNSGFMVSIFVRRLFSTSGLVTGYYFDFFSTQEKAHYAYSFLSSFLDYGYDLTPPFLIGRHYFGNSATSANANIWADAFANFGYSGLVLVTAALGLILWIYDSLMQDNDLLIGVLILGIPSLAFSSSSLPTVLLTHGMFLVLAIALVMPDRSLARQSMKVG